MDNQKIKYKLIQGRFIHSKNQSDVEIMKDILIQIDDDGKILKILKQFSEDSELLIQNAEISGEFLQLKPSQFVIPGFIDTHIHAPQYSYAGTATDKPLMQWLDHYTFPVEQAFDNPDHAKFVYSKLIQRGLSEGTTTAMYYATIHLQASKILADLMEKFGQRGFVGMLQMDQNSPKNYMYDTNKCVENAEELIKYIQNEKSNIIMPVITPRFIPTCSMELMKKLGKIAKEKNIHVQSHISESLDEMAFVDSLHPGRRDAEIFDEAGLLTEKCVMAHATHVTQKDREILKLRGSSISHCPLSNFYFGDGILQTRKILDEGLKIGLGSDVAGGYSISILSQIRSAVISAKALENFEKVNLKNGNQNVEINFKNAFWLGTLGGAKSLSLENEVGSFEVGKQFDALLIDFGDNIDIFENDTDEDQFQKFINLGDGRNILMTWVKGRIVSQKS
eukprot:TRINITY_DN7966_c1_g2_i1.p1 TRINITY_DN7966_c1_g2~~TRINITY_DN7966_c1_g2_i1.p1  ORF type:complete len:449 (-),score=90.11 TRINITY_DN7966_c1_g2_i1:70-1416(-)